MERMEKNIPCLRRLDKDGEGIDAWRIQKTFDGVTFRACFSDKSSGSKQQGFKMAVCFLHLLNKLLPNLQLSYKGKDVSSRNSRRIYDIPDEFLDKSIMDGLVFG